MLTLLTLTACATKVDTRIPTESFHETPGSLDSWLAAKEQRVDEQFGIVPGSEKRIRWFADKRAAKTRYSIVYLHGFSATRQEIAPVAAMVADALGANLFETRLAGHGLQNNALENIRAEDWLLDAREALDIGSVIGHEIILIGTSTGATLSLAITDQAQWKHVSNVVMISPNFAPRRKSARILTFPGGKLIARIFTGNTLNWTANNAQQEKYWTTSFPVSAAAEMMRLVRFARSMLPLSIEQSLLTIISPDDGVVDPAIGKKSVESICARRNELIEFTASTDPSRHVLAGNILSPESNDTISELIVEFVEANEKTATNSGKTAFSYNCNNSQNPL